MAHPVVMPALGLAQETGKLVQWLRREGELVLAGQPLMEVETDKAVVEVEAPASGVLSYVTAAEGDMVAVGQTIAMLLAPGESPGAGQVRTPAEPSPVRAEHDPTGPHLDSSAEPPPPMSPSNAVLASPKARAIAAERQIDLAQVRGSGPGGAVIAEDLTGLEGRAQPDGGQRWQAMAEGMSRSWQSIPHFFVFREIDASQLLSRLEGLRSVVPPLTVTDLILEKLASCLTNDVRMNSGQSGVSIGIAVALDDGLIVPVLHQADKLELSDIARERKRLVEGARVRKLRLPDLSGATFTLSNLGMYGVDAFTAIVPEGQAGILAVGAISDGVVAVRGSVAVQPRLTLVLSSDHRAVDGARSALFLDKLARSLEETD